MSILSEEKYNEVVENGYTTISNAISRDLAADLRSRLADLVQTQRKNQTEQTASDDYMVHNPMFLDSAFMDLLEHPSVVEVFDTFLSSTSIVYACTTSSMPAGSSNYSGRIHVDSPRIIPNYFSKIGVIIALDDFTEANGATYVLPRSQTMEIPPTDSHFYENAQRLIIKAGDFAILDPRTWHCGGMNRSDTDRHAFTISGCRSFMRQRFDYPRFIDDASELSPTLRRLLGFNVRVPASMHEYYLPAEERLYKPNQG
jgi:ectoine hydroxylase-related dioxygenase (phytanoyl-CoA dioxygenase family)